MDRILAVVESPDTDIELLEEAGTVAATMGVEVVVLVLVLESDESSPTEVLLEWDGFDGVSTDEPAATANRFADHLGDEVLSPLEAEYLAIGEQVEITQPSEKIIDVAKNHGCDHIYLPNRSRSPTGKALFGNTAQSVILNFDGFVTVQTT